MFGTKKGAVAKALVLAPTMPDSKALRVEGKSADRKLGIVGKAASAAGTKAK